MTAEGYKTFINGSYDMEKWTGEFGSPLPVGAKDGYGSLSGICGADDGCTGIYGK